MCIILGGTGIIDGCVLLYWCLELYLWPLQNQQLLTDEPSVQFCKLANEEVCESYEEVSKLGLVAHPYNPSTQEAEAGTSKFKVILDYLVLEQPGLCSDILSKQNKSPSVL